MYLTPCVAFARCRGVLTFPCLCALVFSVCSQQPRRVRSCCLAQCVDPSDCPFPLLTLELFPVHGESPALHGRTCPSRLLLSSPFGTPGYLVWRCRRSTPTDPRHDRPHPRSWPAFPRVSICLVLSYGPPSLQRSCARHLRCRRLLRSRAGRGRRASGGTCACVRADGRDCDKGRQTLLCGPPHKS
ncbi:hypothetical protein C8R43DRAFT_1005304, partial [Mycena crocata]